MMHNVLLIDNEIVVAKATKNMVDSFEGFIVSEISNSSFEALKIIKEKTFDFVIVDINLTKEREGLEIAKRLNEINIPFIFLTACYDQKTLLISSLYNPAGFIVKPIQKANLFANLEIVRIKHLEKDILKVSDGKKEYFFKLSQIYYIRSTGNYCEINTVDGKVLLRGKLLDWVLRSDHLVRVNKSYVVNKLMIDKKVKKEIQLKNGEFLPFSESYQFNSE